MVDINHGVPHIDTMTTTTNTATEIKNTRLTAAELDYVWERANAAIHQGLFNTAAAAIDCLLAQAKGGNVPPDELTLTDTMREVPSLEDHIESLNRMVRSRRPRD